MLKRHAFTSLVVATAVLLCGGTVLGAAPKSLGNIPDRYVIPQLDGTPVVVENPWTGLAWSAWAYRSGGEFDLAISYRDAGGVWSPPEFFGENNGFDEVEPALAVDGSGNVYLAFAVRELGRVFLSILSPRSAFWSAPVPVSASEERAASPTLLVLGNQLIVGYRTGRQVALRVIPLVTGNGVQDGPDILPPPGAKGPRDDPPTKVPPTRSP